MNRTIVIFKAMTKNWFRSRSGIFFSLLFPLMLLVVFGSIFGSGAGGSYNLAVQNNDISNGVPTQASQAFISALNKTTVLSVKNISPQIDAKRYVANTTNFLESPPRVLVIPYGFQAGLINGTTRIRLMITYSTAKNFTNSFGLTLPQDQRQALQESLSAMNSTIANIPKTNISLTFVSEPDDQGGAVVRSIVTSVANSLNYGMIGAKQVISFSDESIVVAAQHPIDYYLPGYIGAFIMTNGIIGVAGVVTDLKRRGVVKRLSVTPLKRYEWVLGNVLFQAFLALVLTVIMIGVGMALFNVTVFIDVYTAILLFLGAVLFSGIGMIIAGIIKDPEAANGLSEAVAFPMMFLSGSFWPMEVMPSFMQSVARFLPLTYFSDALRKTMILQNAPAAFPDAVITAGLAVAFIIIGSFLTEWKQK